MSQRRQNRMLDRSTDEVEHDLDDAIKDCVRFIICREGSKIPIKRAEIQKYLTANHQTPNNKINTVIGEANKILKKIYGCNLVKVDAKGGLQYIVVLVEECESLMSTAIDIAQRRMLIAGLTHVFMSGGPVKEEDLWRFLEEAGLLEENDHASRKHFISMATKQMYLTYTKVGEGELARNVFEWGQRATEEVPKIFLLKKMAVAFEKTPDHWCEQYKDATEEQESATNE